MPVSEEQLTLEQREYQRARPAQDNPPSEALESGRRDGQELHSALDRAFERAEISKAELLKSPEMLSGEDLGRELGLSRATIDNRRVDGKLLALEFGSKRGFRYPRWQRELLEERTTREQFEAVLEHLKSVGAWSRYRFFTQSAPALGGETPLEVLRAGAADRVLAAADTWARGEQGGA